MTTTPSAQVGANVRAEMARAGVTQLQLSDLTGISQPSISARLRGATPWTVNDIFAVAHALHCQVDALISGADAA